MTLEERLDKIERLLLELITSSNSKETIVPKSVTKKPKNKKKQLATELAKCFGSDILKYINC